MDVKSRTAERHLAPRNQKQTPHPTYHINARRLCFTPHLHLPVPLLLLFFRRALLELQNPPRIPVSHPPFTDNDPLTQNTQTTRTQETLTLAVRNTRSPSPRPSGPPPGPAARGARAPQRPASLTTPVALRCTDKQGAPGSVLHSPKPARYDDEQKQTPGATTFPRSAAVKRSVVRAVCGSRSL